MKSFSKSSFSGRNKFITITQKKEEKKKKKSSSASVETDKALGVASDPNPFVMITLFLPENLFEFETELPDEPLSENSEDDAFA